jgi:hypothetical protein
LPCDAVLGHARDVVWRHKNLLVAALALGGCGGARAMPDTSRVTEPPGPSITATTIGRAGRATPFGVSGVGDVAVIDGTTLDPTYGYTPENPVRVGGFGSDDPESGQRAYLGALYGPEGQPIYYERVGSQPGADCVLDVFAITYEGLGDQPLLLYVDLYHRERLRAPLGLRGLGPVAQ